MNIIIDEPKARLNVLKDVVSFSPSKNFLEDKKLKSEFNENLKLEYIKCFDSSQAIVDTCGELVGFNLDDAFLKSLYPSEELITGKDLQDKNIYRTPKLNLPQIKVDNIKKKYNVKVKRNLTDADFIVTSKNYITSLYTYSWNRIFLAQDLLNWYNKTGEQFFHHTDGAYIKSMLSGIVEDSPDAYVRYNLKAPYQGLSDKLLKHLNIDSYNSMYKGSELLENAIQPYFLKDLDRYNDLVNNKASLISDINISKICNEDSVTLTIDDAKNIATMVKGGDSENLALAVEMLANCNTDESYDKIALIFAFYMDFLKSASNWNHVNVKTLRTAMQGIPQIDSWHQNIHRYEVLVKVLDRNNKLTKFAIGAIKNKIFTTVLKRIGLNNERGIFEFSVKDLKLKKDYVPCDLPF
jgi:hypothetical protein